MTGPVIRRRAGWMVAGGLILVTLLAYWPALRAGFVNLDDDVYVERAPLIQRGLRAATVTWALTSVHTANWHPLTTLSHALDCDLFGVAARPMHAENIAWHVLNTLLVLALIHRLTGAWWRSVLVAALFALHPLHVESVAWISSRKDLLSTAGWLAGLLLYCSWAKRPSWRRYAGMLAFLTLGLLAKPMVVTFPFTLLLLDYWPLRRWPALPWRRLVTEKLPVFGMVLAHAVVTFVVQHRGGAADYAARFDLSARVGNAFVSYARYLGKTFWPESLAPLYFHPGHWPALAVAGSVALFAALSAAAWWQRRTRPWLLFGWLWFTGTLVPVIGLVQVGAQAMADRYTYVSLLGIFAALVWLAAEAIERSGARRVFAGAAAAAVLAACSFVTFRQAATWHDNLTLYPHSLAVGEDNPAVRYLYGAALLGAGREDEAMAQFNRALELQPDYVNARTQLAVHALSHQDLATGRRLLELNVEQQPKNAALYVSLGAVRDILQDPEGAQRALRQALVLNPRNVDAHRLLAMDAVKHGRAAEARGHYEAILNVDPWNVYALGQLGVLRVNEGRIDEGRRLLERALWIAPSDAYAQSSLQVVIQLQGKPR